MSSMNPNAFAQTAESEDTAQGQIEEFGNLESLEALLVELETMTPQEKQNVDKHIKNLLKYLPYCLSMKILILKK